VPLDNTAVGHQVGRISTTCDARWLMSYAAGVPDERPALYDTSTTLAVHPLFPVAPEWELITSMRASSPGMTIEEARRGIHTAHDLISARNVRAGESIDITAQVVGVDRRPAGATQQSLFVATDASGTIVWRTLFTTLFLGVDLVGEPAHVDIGWPVLPDAGTTSSIAERTSFVRSIDAHVYSECARIWNPIHTDVVAARAAGLEAPILHGTATLARAGSSVTDLAGVDLSRVERIAGRFRSPVDLGTTVTVRLLGIDDSYLGFEVARRDGQVAIAGGVAGLRPD
jgi:acyl dehydratase